MRVRNVVPERSSPKITKLRLFSLFVLGGGSGCDWLSRACGCDQPVGEKDLTVFPLLVDEVKIKFFPLRIMNVQKASIIKMAATKERKTKRK